MKWSLKDGLWQTFFGLFEFGELYATIATYSFSCSCESVDLCSLNEERFDERFGEPVTFNLVKLTQLPRRPPRLPFSASEDSPGADNLLTVSKR